MSKPEINRIKKTIPRHFYDDDECMDLDNCYNLTVAELGLQQTKRDQILALYLAILGFVVPSIVNLEVHDLAKAFAFICMYLVGMMLTHVILRYRIYKEVYWIACRVISQLCNIKHGGRNKDVILTLFYHTLEKNLGTIVKYRKRDEKNPDPNAPKKRSIIRSFRRQLNSAETLLFETLALFSTAVGFVGSFYIFPHSIAGGILTFIFIIAMLVSVNYKYTSRLMELYKCIDSGDPKDLLIPFGKAWMLECYIDDVPLEDEDDTN